MKKICTGIIFGLLLLGWPQSAFAARATMHFSPQSGSFEKPFTVSLIIDGHGEKFNAAQATVTVPKNLIIRNLLLGDCNFSFFDTPNIQNPSFKGIILGTSSEKCTVYTLTMGSKTKGKASLSLTHAQIKRYGDAAEILSTKQNGNYTLTNIFDPNSVLGAQTLMSPKDGLYSLTINVVSNEKKPIENAFVTISPVSKKNEKKIQTDIKGIARFTKLTSGIYQVSIEKNGKKLGEQIINISGPNYTINLSITVQNQKNNLPMPLLLTLILLAGAVVGIIVSLLFNKLRISKGQPA